jgi:hypothetical protein
MQNIPCGLTPAELPAREQLHEQNNDFTTMIQYFFESLAEKIKKIFMCWAHRSFCTGLMLGGPKMLRWRGGFECARYAHC